MQRRNIGRNMQNISLPPDGRYFRKTIEAVNATGVLIAVNDHDNHVAIYPVVYHTIEEWRESRPNANTNPHPYSLLLRTLER